VDRFTGLLVQPIHDWSRDAHHVELLDRELADFEGTHANAVALENAVRLDNTQRG
jgi:hypothetical protein